MALPLKYQVDPEVAANVSRRFMQGFCNVGRTGLSNEEQSVLRFALERLDQSMPRDPLAFTTPYIEAIIDMFKYAKRDYDNLTIGSWSFAGFCALTDLGIFVAERDHLNFAARIHYKSQITTAAMLPTGGTLDSAVALYMKYLIKQGLGFVIVRSLESQKEQYDKRIDEARESRSINEWLSRLANVSPLTNAQFLIYRCLVRLIQQGHLTDGELSPYGLSLENCKEDEKRFEEIAAYTYSPGVSLYKDNPDTACLLYVDKIAQMARQEGRRIAKRQAQYDFARMMIPRFLKEDALNAADECCPDNDYVNRSGESGGI